MMKRFTFIILIAVSVLSIRLPADAAGRHAERSSTAIQETKSPERAKINDVYVIHFVLDGLNKKAFERALSEGKLPTIKKHFVDNGATFTHALSNFPSTSTTIYQSYVTGLLPGHAGIPHLERLDRQGEEVIGYLTAAGHGMVNSDLINLRALTNPDVAEIEPPTTIFELLRGHPTAAVYSLFHRGASFAHPEKAPVRALWSTYITENEERVDVLAMRKVMRLFEGDIDEIPRYTLVGLYSADIFGHEYGPQSPEVQDVLVQFDLFLRDFLDLLARSGILDKTYVIVSADHGMHESGELFEFQKALEEKGIFVKPKNPRKRGYTLYAANRGVASSHIYVRHNGGFGAIDDPEILRRHPTKGGDPVDLIDLILRLEATDLLIVRAGERSARIFSRDGKSADVACYTIGLTDFCSYRFDRLIGDPLGYDSDPSFAKLLDGRPHSALAWRDATADERYPDAVIQLSQIFHDGRAGDAFISTRDRWGFRKVKLGNHGGAGEEDMRVPLLIAGPAMPKGTFGVARPPDIYPLLLEWFGLHVPQGNHEGVNPFKPHGGEDANLQRLAAIEQVIDGKPPLYKMIGIADFVRKEVYAVAKSAEFPRLLALAKEESSRRAMLVRRLKELLKSLQAQKAGEEAPRIADPSYLGDHIAIVGRTLDWAAKGVQRMEDVVAILEKCRNAGSSECQNL